MINNQETERISALIADIRENGISLTGSDGKLRFEAAQGVMTDELLNTLKENKEAILEILEREKTAGQLCVGQRGADFALTDVQSAYLLGRKDVFQYGNTACHIYMEVEYPQLDEKRVEGIWNILIKRHSMLRVIFDDSGTQRILDTVPPYQLYTGQPEHRNKSADEIRQDLGHKIYNPAQWPLFDIACIRIQNGSALALSVDFMIGDWASIWILIGEFEQLYVNSDAQLAALEFEFSDYIACEERQRTMPQFYRDKAYWMRRLEKLPGRPRLPVLNRSGQDRQVEFKRYCCRIEETAWERIKAAAKSFGVTPSVTVMTVYAMIIAKWSENKHFLLNLTLLNRLNYGKAIENIIGDFTNVLLLETDFTGNRRFREYAAQLQLQLVADLEHRLFSGIDVLRRIGTAKGNDDALMPIVFTSGIGVVDRSGTGSFCGIYKQDGISQTPQVFIDCQVLEQQGALLVNWDVRQGVFLPHVIEAMFSAFEQSFGVLAKDLSIWENHDLMDMAGKHCEIETKYEHELPAEFLHTAVFAQAKLTPFKTAVISSKEVWTYGELADKSRAVCTSLRQRGCPPGSYVGIVMPKSNYQVAAVLGTLLGGFAYVPIDVHNPADRIQRIMESAQIQYVLTLTYDARDWPSGTVVIAADALAVNPESAGKLDEPADNQKPAYVIFTSGSTGTPKGVVISHAAALNTIVHVNNLLQVSSEDSILGVSRLGFDLSVYDIFGLLSVGGSLVYPDEQRLTDPSHLYDLLDNYHITLWNSVPAICEMIVDYKENEGIKERLYVRKILLSGDWIPLSLPDRCTGNFAAAAEVISLGGATEASIWSIYYRCRGLDNLWNSIPYGKALPNQRVYILDKERQLCPIGTKGTIYIAGAGVAAGYLNEPELTARHFVEMAGVRLYDTGDKGRYMADGNIEFLGREDTQVKVNGYRIELGETESNLEKVDGVKRACVLLKTIGTEHKLVAFVEKSVDCDMSEAEFTSYVKMELAKLVPLYMLPHYYLMTERIPLTGNGKTDRNALAAIIIPTSEAAKTGAAKTGAEESQPYSSVYRSVKEIWCALLRQPDVGADIDLHAFGADSLLMAQAVGKIRKEYDIPFDILLRQMLINPTISGISAFIEGELPGCDSGYKTPGEDKNTEPLRDCTGRNEQTGCLKIYQEGQDGHAFIFFHAGLGTLDEFSPFIDALCQKTCSAVVGVALSDPRAYCELKPEQLFETVARDYTQQLAGQNYKTLHLMGHCIGGMIACEVAKNMIYQNTEITALSLIDSVPGIYRIEDEIVLELMFLPVFHIAYSKIPQLGFTEENFYHYLSVAAEQSGGIIRGMDINDPKTEAVAHVLSAIHVLRAMNREERMAIYRGGTDRDIAPELFDSLYHVFRQSTLASAYTPIPYMGSARLYKAERINEVIPEQPGVTARFWNDICLGGVRTITVPGNHFTCIEEPENAANLADLILSVH